MAMTVRFSLAVLCSYFLCFNVNGLSVGPSKRVEADVPELTNEKLNRFIVVPEHHLLFCYIEKVGCTNFNMLFNRLRAKYHPEQAVGSVWHRNDPAKVNLTKDDLAAILVNKTWHKAVFYRDPVERFVSAYASKCGGADRNGAVHCKRQFGNEETSFQDAVQFVADFDASKRHNDRRFDEHFMLMGSFCGGLSSTLQYYDTVEELDVATANAKVSELLKAVGVDPQSIAGFDELFPQAGTKEALGDSNHVTDSEDSMDEYFPPEAAEYRRHVLMEHYKPDYELFGISVPGGVSFKQGFTSKLRWPLLSE